MSREDHVPMLARWDDEGRDSCMALSVCEVGE